MNRRTREALVEEHVKKFYDALMIANKEAYSHIKIKDDEIISEADLLSAIQFLSTIIAARVIVLGENEKELLTHVNSLLGQCVHARINFGLKTIRNLNLEKTN